MANVEVGPTLTVPLALGEGGEEVRPEAGERGVRYSCPSCGGAVAFRCGPRKRHHFYHLARPVVCDFLNETEAHWQAKQRVIRMIAERRTVWLDRRCDSCDERIKQPIPARVARDHAEYPLPSGHRVDVALLDVEDSLVGVIEVLATHEVGEEKARAMEALKWGEIRAETILDSDEWEVKRDHFAAFTCERCREKATYTRLYGFEGPQNRHVQCPLYGMTLLAVDSCARCGYFLDVGEAGVACYGSAGRHGTH
jgi:predicted nucleic-acid-binding Zn-ribbon protein